MEILVEPTAARLARIAAEFVADAVRAAPSIVLALPTGRTPLGMYSELVQMHQQGLDFSGVRVFSLDEYLGIPPYDVRSFSSYLWRQFLGSVNIRPENVRLMPAIVDDASARQYEQDIDAAGGIDLLIAGVGSNGHIAFNEPGSPLDSRTRAVDLADSTVDRMRSVFAPDELPKRAATIGIGTILDARRILLIAAGEAKRGALDGLFHGPVTINNPVSVLRMHSDVTVITVENPGPDLSRCSA